jgi:hypothetical protein
MLAHNLNCRAGCPKFLFLNLGLGVDLSLDSSTSFRVTWCASPDALVPELVLDSMVTSMLSLFVLTQIVIRTHRARSGLSQFPSPNSIPAVGNSSNPSDSCAYKRLIPQLSSIENLTNAPGWYGGSDPKIPTFKPANVLTPVESALPKNSRVTPSESALPKTQDLKPSRIGTCKKG